MRSAFRRHLKSHDETSLKCQKCQESFLNIFNLCVHSEKCEGSLEEELKISPRQVIKQGSQQEKTESVEGKDRIVLKKKSPVKRKANVRTRMSLGKNTDIDGKEPLMQVCEHEEISNEPIDDVKNVESLLQNGIKIEVREIDLDSDEVGNGCATSDCNVNGLIQKAENVESSTVQSKLELDLRQNSPSDEEEIIEDILIESQEKLRKSKRERAKPKAKFICDVCNKEFAFMHSLQRHTKTVHNNDRPYTCDQCDQSFKLAQSLKTHKRMHTDERPYACSQCKQSFRQAGTLKQHERSHKGQKVYSCKYCSAKFTRSMRLKIHQRSHTGERPYQCDECGLGFADPQIFKKHQMNHRGEKPYVCPDCGKCFVMARYLTEHRKMHTGEKAYLCATCGSAFANAGRLTRHMRVHTHSKKHQCKICNKAFAYKEGLDAHVNNHMGLKPYSCKTCKKSFTHRTGLTQHQAVHTKDWRFTCHICDHSFATMAKLRRHSALHPSTEKECQIMNICAETVGEVVPEIAAVVETEAIQKQPMREEDNKQKHSHIQGPYETHIVTVTSGDIQEEVPAIDAVIETEGTKEQKETEQSCQALLESIGAPKAKRQHTVPLPVPVSVQNSKGIPAPQALIVNQSQCISQQSYQSLPITQPVSQSQAFSQPASQSLAYIQTTSHSKPSHAASQSQAMSQPASQSQAYSQLASQSKIVSHQVSQSHAFSQPASQSQTFSQPVSQSQTFSQPASQSQAFSQPASQSQAFAQASQQQQQQQQLQQQQQQQQQQLHLPQKLPSQIMTVAALKPNPNQTISLTTPSQDATTSFAQTILPTTYTTLGVIPPATSCGEYHMLPTGQNILYQAAGVGSEHQAHVQVIERVGVVNHETGLTIMEIQVPRDSTPLTVQIQRQ